MAKEKNRKGQMGEKEKKVDHPREENAVPTDKASVLVPKRAFLWPIAQSLTLKGCSYISHYSRLPKGQHFQLSKTTALHQPVFCVNLCSHHVLSASLHRLLCKIESPIVLSLLTHVYVPLRLWFSQSWFQSFCSSIFQMFPVRPLEPSIINKFSPIKLIIYDSFHHPLWKQFSY